MSPSRFLNCAILILYAYFSPIVMARAGRHWVTLTNCRYLPNPANDGDSFHVRAGKREYIFRLYFVDSPETDTSLPDRVAEQAKYFGTTTAQTLQIGREAERFTRQHLAQPFTVRTCKQDARGRSRLKRYFAFVQTGNADLGEQLVANGLARVYGAANEAPEMNAPEVEWRKLEQFERKAKEQKIGGWGINNGRLDMRAAVQPVTSADYFDAFFHSGQTPLTAQAESPATTPSAKLDVNTASMESLQNIPGVGLAMAKRIIAARPYRNADDLSKVKGIGETKYKKLRPYFK